MNIHLVKSSEVDATLFTKVVNFLQSIPGAIRFHFDNDSIINFDSDETVLTRMESHKEFERKTTYHYNTLETANRIFPMEREASSWENLFKKSQAYRKRKQIPDDQFVLLLTDMPNIQNWFAALDEKMPYNGFIHTADWDHYIKASPAFPIAYEVVALALQKHFFGGLYELRTKVHETPIGCINDLCMHKREIILKLRTGDICEDCILLANGKLSMPVLHHALHIMSSLRENMLFAQNLKQFSPLSRLVIDGGNKITLPDFGNIEIRLRPLEKALYFLFLRYPQGIYNSSLSEHRNELYQIYSSISNTGDLSEMRIRIDDMTNALSDSASQKMSRIKRVFEESIGNELAKHYYIKGESGQEKKIELKRELVTVERD